ncbi:MAG: polysulfide reductase NrfD [Ketobacter sp.]|nr:polysulfide reductase NrfD [Ketobacter sp.]
MMELNARSDEILKKHDAIFRPLRGMGPKYYITMTILVVIMIWGGYSYMQQVRQGLSVTGLNRPVFWGMYIGNFVFFIAISYGGTLTSAILRMLKAEWRRPITRLAEVITVCALIVGSFNVVMDMGRPDRLWQLFAGFGRIQSPILWDVIAVNAYLVFSVVYLYLPLIPDIAFLRDNNPGSLGWLYRILSLGWNGSKKQWHRLEKIVDWMAVLMVPLAISVHTVLAWIFGMTIQPMWHSSIMGPYFVMGAIYSGIAALIITMAILRRTMKLEKYLTLQHFQNFGNILLVMTFAWLYFTIAEYLTTYYGSEPAHIAVFNAKLYGEFAPLFWGQVLFCLIIPVTILVIPPLRTIPLLVVAGISVNIGMWIERFLIVVPTLTRPRLPYGIFSYAPTFTEWSIMLACTAWLIFMFMLFLRFFPIVSVWEIEEGEMLAAGVKEEEAPSQPASVATPAK